VRRSRGFTLLEMLVAILLVSLAAALVVQGIGQAMGLLARVAADQGEVYHELMARAWLRQSIAAAIPAGADEAGFRGDGRGLQLQTFRPLLGAEGIPTAIGWEFDGGGGLNYIEGDQQMLVTALAPVARLAYEDGDGAWVAAWPAKDETGLPERVRLEFADGDHLDILLVSRDTPARQDDAQGNDED